MEVLQGDGDSKEGRVKLARALVQEMGVDPAKMTACRDEASVVPGREGKKAAAIPPHTRRAPGLTGQPTAQPALLPPAPGHTCP